MSLVDWKDKVLMGLHMLANGVSVCIYILCMLSVPAASKVC